VGAAHNKPVVTATLTEPISKAMQQFSSTVQQIGRSNTTGLSVISNVATQVLHGGWLPYQQLNKFFYNKSE
jgi:hypothetical protein